MPNDHTAPSSLSCVEARQVDEYAMNEWSVPDILLMENAGRGCTDTLLSVAARPPILVCCGKGNNGGDGLVMTRQLVTRGVPVVTLLIADEEELTDPARVNFEILRQMRFPVTVTRDVNQILSTIEGEHGCIVDALLGTGFRGKPRSPMKEAIAAINASAAIRFAIDLPSGLNGDTGEYSPWTVYAHHTCTLVAPKHGLLTDHAAAVVGQIHVADIGVPFPT